MTTNEQNQMYFNCLMIEAFVKTMVIRGETNNAELVKAVDGLMCPQTSEEMEAYSEAIIYAKCSVLN
jgi:hypothetical protein